VLVGIGFECQVVERVPTDEHDVRLHKVITPRGVISVSVPVV
jgi:5-formyltetrahydrofolate cyclo-ligase